MVLPNWPKDGRLPVLQAGSAPGSGELRGGVRGRVGSRNGERQRKAILAPMSVDVLERWIRGIGAAGLATLAFAVWQGVWQARRHPSGRTTGSGARVLVVPLQLLFGSLWIGVCLLLWHPIPVALRQVAHIAALGLGSAVGSLGLGLYWWGARTLGRMYRASSAFGVQLNVGHQLVTSGPFALTRHPLYLGLQLAGIGGLLLFRTWTFAYVVASFLALVFRAGREEQALAAEFGEAWDKYARSVPVWIPRPRRKPG